MKDYFNFNLTGKKLLPVWIVFLITFLAPYVALIFQLKDVQPGDTPSLWIFPLIILLLLIAFILAFYIAKLTIENVSYKDKSIVFNGTIGKYTGTVILGLFLSIITLGVYLAWFIRNIHGFFIDNSSYNSMNFKFQGKGGKLFVILLLTLLLPIIIFAVLMAKFMISDPGKYMGIVIIQQIVMMIIMIPYMYLIYKWMVNVDYKDYHIKWETDFWNSCGKIAVEMILTIITIGIYMPLAGLRLYKYFAEKTTSTSDERKLKFGYDIDPLNDFLFIWGQSLLTIITLGIYFPWAFCKIGDRILSKTYLAEA